METIVSTSNYLDFDLQIEAVPQGYRAEVLNSPVGPAATNFRLPFSQAELENLILNLGRTRYASREELAATREFGWQLFNAIFTGEMQKCLGNSLTEAYRRGTGLRIRLRLNSPELLDLPWEYLYSPTFNDFLGLLQQVALVRYLDPPAPVAPVQVEPPLKVLVLIANPSHYPQLDVAGEWQKLKDSVYDLEEAELINLEKVEESGLDGLQYHLRNGNYHVLHFIGHGYYEWQRRDGVLILENQGGQGQAVSGQELGRVLSEHPTLRLVTLYACEGSRTSKADPFAVTAQSLIQQGIPAVLSMQFEMGDPALHTQSSVFYSALTQGQAVDLALSETRRAVFVQSNDVEWASASLYMSAPEGRVFEMASLNNEQQIQIYYRKAQDAAGHEDWGRAVENLKALLTLDPYQTEAQELLKQAEQKQELAKLYRVGQEHYQAGRWCEALKSFKQLQKAAPAYKDLDGLIKTSGTECQKIVVHSLHEQAEAAIEKEDWTTALVHLEKLERLGPGTPEVAERLSYVKQQQDLANLYATGQEHYNAGRWCEAAETFRQVQEIGGNYANVRTLLAVSDDECRRLQIASLPQEAEAAFQLGDWATATAKLQRLLELDPLQFEARDKLNFARQQQEWAALYATGQEHYQAGRWFEALMAFREIQSKTSGYKDVSTLITELEHRLNQEQQDAKLAALYDEADANIEREKWPVAIERLKTILSLDPSQAQAETKLAQVRQQQEWATLYATGQDYYKGGQWREALRCFQQLQKTPGNYKDVETLIPDLEARLEKMAQAEANYLDFDLQIIPATQGYRAEVTSSPAGQAFNNFRLPLSQLDLENFILSLGRTRYASREELAATREFGWQLFNAMFGSDMKSVLATSLNEASRRGTGLRLRLDLKAVPELVDLPWEYLYYPALNDFWGLLEQVALVRYLETPNRVRALPLDPPLKVLAVISSPTDYPQLDLEKEWVRLKESLAEAERDGLVIVERVERANLPALQQKFLLNNYHILHFVGPGFYDALNKTGVLVFEGQDKRSQAVSSAELGQLLGEQTSLRLVVLNASEGSRTSRTDPFAATAQSLVQQNIPAVVSMQFEIGDEVGVAWATSFYNGLGQGKGVDLALSAARQTAFAKGNDVEWASAVLYTATPDGRIFDVAPLSTEQQVEALYRRALAATKREEWSQVVEQLKAIIALDPTHAGITESLMQARHQQELASYYAAGEQHHQAGRWCEAVSAFRQLQELELDYRDVAQLLEESEVKCKQSKVTALHQQAQVALEQKDWATAIDRLQNLLLLDSTDTEAQNQLKQAQQEQEVEQLYTAGQQHYNASRWRDALAAFVSIQQKVGDYRDVTSLIPVVQRLAQAEEEQAKAAQLRADAQAALDREDWKTVFEIVGQLQILGPNYADTANSLSLYANQQQELAFLYEVGQEHFKAERWPEAQATFQQVKEKGGSYKEVDKYLAEVERKLYGEPEPAVPPNYNPYQAGTALAVADNPNPPQLSQDQLEAQVRAGLPESFFTYYQPQTSHEPGLAYTGTVVADRGQAAAVIAPQPRAKNELPMWLRIIWLVLLGWWLGLLWGALSYLVSVTVVFLDEGVSMFNRLPQIMTLKPLEKSAEPKAPEQPVHQLNILVRILYYSLIGWWFGLLWSFVGYLLCLPIVSMPLGIEMLNRLPQVLTLQRRAAPTLQPEAAKARPISPDKYVAPNPAKDKRLGLWLTLIIIFWALVPIAAIALLIINKLILKR